MREIGRFGRTGLPRPLHRLARSVIDMSTTAIPTAGGTFTPEGELKSSYPDSRIIRNTTPSARVVPAQRDLCRDRTRDNSWRLDDIHTSGYVQI
jgi:hypothetical protein